VRTARNIDGKSLIGACRLAHAKMQIIKTIDDWGQHLVVKKKGLTDREKISSLG